MSRIILSILIGLLAFECTRPQPVYRTDGAYPHPFCPTTNFTVEGFGGQSARVELFNVIGESVGVVYEGIMDSVMVFDLDPIVAEFNSRAVEHDSAAERILSMTPGIFFFRVQTADSSFTKKFILLK